MKTKEAQKHKGIKKHIETAAKNDQKALEKAYKLLTSLKVSSINFYIENELKPSKEKAKNSGTLWRYAAADEALDAACYIRDHIILSQ